MASLGQYCTRNCLSSNNSLNILSISQPCNANQFRSIVTNQYSTRATFCQLPSGGKKYLINIIQKRKEDQWRLWCSDDGSCGIAPLPPPIPSTSNLIHDFYSAINAKDTEELQDKVDPLLSQDCVYQDLFFYIPFQGKQDVKNFLCNVMEAMGPNIRTVVVSVREGENYTATVMWHLEWNHKEIPFAGGCHFFECDEYEGKLLI
ncbi:Nuclear transport factor 2 family protein, putative, partial [Fagus crenata]